MNRLFSQTLVLFCLIALCNLPAALAQVPAGCNAVNSSGNTYPEPTNAYYCGTSSQSNGNLMVRGVGNSNTQELKRLGVSFYLFHNMTEYTNANLVADTKVAGNYGVTGFNSQLQPIWIAVWELNGTVAGNVQNRTGFQLGIAFDYQMSFVTSGGVIRPTNYQVSTTSDFGSELDIDVTNFKAKPSCGANAVFYGKQDASGNYICNGTSGQGTGLNPPYSGYADNVVRLQHAYPAAFQKNSTLIAEEYAANKILNDGSVNSPDSYLSLTTNFACSGTFAYIINVDEEMPIGPNDTGNFKLPAGCMSPAIKTACVKLFNANTQWPAGNVFNCDNTTSTASTMLNDFFKLGSLGHPSSYTQIRQTLNGPQSNIYVFKNAAAYSGTGGAFTIAGQITAPLTNNVAGTYPNDPVRYSIVLEDPDSQTGSIPFVAARELGIVFDDTQAQSSSSSQFDLAMQHDRVQLNWVSYPLTPVVPCAVKNLNGLTYNGPLINAIDPATGKQFCSNETYVAGSVWAKNNPATNKPYLTSEILKDPTEYGYSNGFSPVQYQAAGATSPSIGLTYQTVPGWREWHAQAFAIRVQSDISITAFNPIFSVIVQNGYFPCTAGPTGWAQLEYSTGLVVPPANYPCQTSLPNGWIEIK